MIDAPEQVDIEYSIPVPSDDLILQSRVNETNSAHSSAPLFHATYRVSVLRYPMPGKNSWIVHLVWDLSFIIEMPEALPTVPILLDQRSHDPNGTTSIATPKYRIMVQVMVPILS
jgi:hypothetical protein